MRITKQTETVVKHTVTLEMSEQEYQVFRNVMCYNVTVPEAIYSSSDEKTEKETLTALMLSIYHNL